MSKTIDWYFDFISPFAYLQQLRFQHFPAEVTIRAIPVLFAGLLNHWGSKGPAEIPAKRLFTYQHVRWLAKQHGATMRLPPAHPFNPLPALRLAIALDNDLSVIAGIFDYIWRDGLSIDDAEKWTGRLREMGIENTHDLITQDKVKQNLRENTAEAIRKGVFGVPTIIADGHLFWGYDASDMYLDFLHNPALFEDSEMRKIESMPAAASRN